MCTCHQGIGDCLVHGDLDRTELKHGRRVRIVPKEPRAKQISYRKVLRDKKKVHD